MIDPEKLFADLLASPRVKVALQEILQKVVREELEAALPSTDELVDAKEAARLVCMTEAGVRRAAARGQLKCVRIGRRVRFKRGDLLKWRDR